MELEAILNYARTLGADQAEVTRVQGEGFFVQTRMETLEKVEHFQDHHVEITVYHKHRQGSASSSGMQKAAIVEMVEKACEIARYTEQDPHFGLSDSAEFAQTYPQLAIDFPCTLSMEDAIEQTLACESMGLSQDTRICQSEGASFNTYRTHYALANSAGFSGTYAATSHQRTCTLLAEAQGHMHSDTGYSVARCVEDLYSSERIACEAATGALAQLGARAVPTQKVPVLLHAKVASSLFKALFQAISGRAQYQHNSFLLDALGTQILPRWVTVSEDPFMVRGLGSVPYDTQGVKVQANTLIDQGILQTYLLERYSARRLGLPNSGHAGGVRNVQVSANATELSALLKQMGTGLLVTSLMGQGVNLLTGDYSRGASGFWIEGGEVAFPVEEVTISGNLKAMLQNIVAIGSDVDIRKQIQCGSILLDAMQIGGC